MRPIEAPHLRVECLGTPQIWLNGEKIKFRTRKALILLIYLIAEPGLHAREKLAALFWANSDEAQARMMLRTTLNHLHQALASAYEQYLLIDRYTVGFNSEQPVDLDLHHIQQAFNSLSATQGDEPTLHLLQQAVHCYRGHFLETTLLEEAPEIEQWITLEQEKYRSQLNAILERLTDLRCQAGLFEQAITTAQLWQKHDPLKEKAYHYLINTYWATGNRLAALQTYHLYQNKLTLELGEGAHPSEELQQLIRKIEHSPDTTENIPAAGADLVIPFVGRTQEYQALMQVYKRSQSSGLQVVEVEGEAGIGKTRLATEFLKWAAVNGADVVQAKAIEVHHQMPYSLWTEALRVRLDQENAPEDLLDNIWLAELARLFPELIERYPDLAVTPYHDPAARSRLFEAITRLGAALAERKLLVIVFDDVQWADADSWDLLLYAARRWSEKSCPILLLCLHRAESEWSAQHDQLTQLVSPHKIELSALPEGDVQTLVAKVLVQATPNTEALERLLVQETAGHPFFMVEMLRELVVSKQIDVSPQGGVQVHLTLETLPRLRGFIPKGIKRLLASRFKSLSADAAALLTAGAVLGHQFTFDSSVYTANLEEMTAATALEELLRKRCLQEHRPQKPTQPARYSFTHDKLREVLYTEVTEARRTVLHRRALEVLQQQAAPAFELAYHALHGHRWDLAITHHLAAAEEAMQLFATREAIQYFERVLQLAEYHPNPAELASHIHCRLGEAYSILSDYPTAMQHYQQGIDLAANTADIHWQARAGLGKMLLYQGQYQTAVGYFEQVAQAAPSTELLADALWGLSAAQGSMGQYDLAIQYARQGGDLCRERDPYRLTGFLGNLGRLHNIKGDFEQGSRLLEESLALCKAIKAYWRMGNMLLALGDGYLERGDYDRACQFYTDGLMTLRKIDNKTGIADALLGLATIALEHENYAESYALLHECLPIFETTHDRWGVQMTYGNLGITALFEQNYPQAIQYLEQGLTVAHEIGNQSGIAHMERHLALVALCQHDFAQAQRSLGTAYQIARTIDRPFLVVSIEVSLAALYLLEDNLPAATDLLARTLAFTCERRAEPLMLDVLAVYTRWYAAQGQMEQATRLRNLTLSHPRCERYARLYLRLLLEHSSLPAVTPVPSEAIAEMLTTCLDELRR